MLSTYNDACMGTLHDLQDSENPLSYKWEPVPEDSPLASEYESILWACRSKCIDLTEGESSEIDQSSSLGIEWNPVKLKRRKGGEQVNVNDLDTPTMAEVAAIRTRVIVSLEEFLHQLAERS